MTKEIWVRADMPDDKEERKELLISAIESGVTTAIVRPEDADLSSLGKMKLITDGDDVRIVDIRSPKDQEKALSLAGKCSAVVISSSDWTIIPLENMIAKFAGTGTKVLACASDPENAVLYLKTMEKGADGVVISVDDPGEIRRFSHLLRDSSGLELKEVEVTAVRNIEMGDRVCVDTVSLMSPGEGMLIGSQAGCLFLVQSESEDSGYVAPRPFRVNAGAVHAYTLTPEGKTRYLEELRSGEPVMIVSRNGSSRISSVGRCKIEVRPMILIEARYGNDRYSTILQNAETVKLVSSDGAISVTELEPGDKVLARIEGGSRHFGMRIEGTLREI
jgi:3-dehydroquinate synthase II